MTPKRLRILVVDDDEDNANSLGELFELEGHHATIAHSGEDAIAAYMASDFDLAFMDVMMPGLNGVESFMEIRKLKPDARVYMMTGYSVEQLLQQAMEYGAMGVLSKPVDIDKLLKAVDEVRPGGIVLIAGEDPDFGTRLKSQIEGLGLCCGHLRRENELVLDAGALAIIDIGKPLINCVEVYSQLRRQGHTSPSVIVTKALDRDADGLPALCDVAVTGILNKPFDPMQLLLRLDSLAV